MAITSAVCNSFKKELLEAKHNFLLSGGHTFKIALYDPNATLGASTTDYVVTDEVSGVGYTAGGNTLTRIDPALDGSVAIVDFADTSWTSATITAAGALIYNTTTGGGSGTTNAVAVLSFSGDQTSTNGTFTVSFPTADATNAVIRIA
jgi:hypothetical protein